MAIQVFMDSTLSSLSLRTLTSHFKAQGFIVLLSASRLCEIGIHKDWKEEVVGKPVSQMCDSHASSTLRWPVFLFILG